MSSFPILWPAAEELAGLSSAGCSSSSSWTSSLPWSSTRKSSPTSWLPSCRAAAGSLNMRGRPSLSSARVSGSFMVRGVGKEARSTSHCNALASISRVKWETRAVIATRAEGPAHSGEVREWCGVAPASVRCEKCCCPRCMRPGWMRWCTAGSASSARAGDCLHRRWVECMIDGGVHAMMLWLLCLLLHTRRVTYQLSFWTILALQHTLSFKF